MKNYLAGGKHKDQVAALKLSVAEVVPLSVEPKKHVAFNSSVGKNFTGENVSNVAEKDIC